MEWNRVRSDLYASNPSHLISSHLISSHLISSNLISPHLLAHDVIDSVPLNPRHLLKPLRHRLRRPRHRVVQGVAVCDATRTVAASALAAAAAGSHCSTAATHADPTDTNSFRVNSTSHNNATGGGGGGGGGSIGVSYVCSFSLSLRLSQVVFVDVAGDLRVR